MFIRPSTAGGGPYVRDLYAICTQFNAYEFIFAVHCAASNCSFFFSFTVLHIFSGRYSNVSGAIETWPMNSI